MNKFKIGDLVTMSAAGQARDHNYTVLTEGAEKPNSKPIGFAAGEKKKS